MFPKMRRKDRLVSENKAKEILAAAEYGVLSVIGENGYPVGTPFNYADDGENIYVHMAKDSYTAKCIEANPHVSFTVVTKCSVIAEEFTTDYESVIVYGTAALLDGKEKFGGLEAMLKKFSKAFMEPGIKHIHEDIAHTNVIKIKIDHMTAKIRSGDGPTNHL